MPWAGSPALAGVGSRTWRDFRAVCLWHLGTRSGLGFTVLGSEGFSKLSNSLIPRFPALLLEQEGAQAGLEGQAARGWVETEQVLKSIS